MGTWSNNDGLYLKFGTDRATAKAAGEYRYDGPERVVEVEIPLASLTTSTNYFASDTATIPNGARVSRVVLYVETAATSGGSATLDVGLVDQDRTTAFDDDGFIAALALAEMSDVGANILFTPGSDSTPAGESGVGALVGTTLSNTGLIVASANTAVFTAGRVVVRIYYYIP